MSRPLKLKVTRKSSLACHKCGHDMGRSRCRVIRSASHGIFFGTTCGKCRQPHEIILRRAKRKAA